MASLTDWADATRREAERSRARSLALRLRVQQEARACADRRVQIETARTQRQTVLFRTPWSTLLWRSPVPADEHVLEPVDGR